jgi:hypothetical protein
MLLSGEGENRLAELLILLRDILLSGGRFHSSDRTWEMDDR